MKTVASGIRFPALLNYRKLKIIALLSMTISQLASIMAAAQKVCVYLELEDPFAGISFLFGIVQGFGQITLPLLMISVMSEILRRPRSIKKIIIENLICALLMLVLNGFAIAIMQFAADTLVQMVADGTFFEKALPLMYDIIRKPGFPKLVRLLLDDSNAEIVNNLVQYVKILPEDLLVKFIGSGEFMSIFNEIFPKEALLANLDKLNDYVLKAFLMSHTKNLFIDVLLCTMTYFFVHYKPKSLRGGKIMLFRLCAAFPLGYMAIGFAINIIVRNGWIPASEYMVSLLPSNSPLTYIVFVTILVFRKYQELEHVAKGGEDLASYFMSPLGAWQMSACLAAVFVVYTLFDLVIGIIPGMAAGGFGSGTWAFLGAPFVLFFSYTKMPKHRWIDTVCTPVYYILNIVLMVIVCAVFVEEAVSAIIMILS